MQNTYQTRGNINENDCSFSLFETIRYTHSVGYHFLTDHFARLEKSCSVFHYIFPRDAILNDLYQLKQKLLMKDYRIRIVLQRNGEFTIEHGIINETKNNHYEKLKIVPSHAGTDSNNILLYHKTSSYSVRGFYEHQFNYLQKKLNIDEIIFFNENKEITEGSKTNIFIEKSGKLYTPPQQCGLLSGITRNRLLKINKNATERILYMDDIINAEKIFLTNAIIGIKEAKLILQHDQIQDA